MTSVADSARHNVCSVIVHLAPQQAEAARALIAAMPGVEIVADGEGSRLAVTVVDTAEGLAIDQVTAMHRTDGVVAVALVYHAIDDAEAEAVEAEASGCTCGGTGECHRASQPINPF